MIIERNLCIPDSLRNENEEGPTKIESELDAGNSSMDSNNLRASSDIKGENKVGASTAKEPAVTGDTVLTEMKTLISFAKPKDTVTVESGMELDRMMEKLETNSRDELLNDFRVDYVGDGAIDVGGVKKQFLTECVNSALKLYFVPIDSGGFRLKTNISKEISYKIGQLLAFSLIHGGPTMHLANYLLDFIMDKAKFLTGSKLPNCEETSNYINYTDPGDEILATFFEKVEPMIDSRDERGLSDYMISTEGRLSLSQYWSDITDGEIDINNYHMFKETVIWRHLIERRAMQLEAFVLGMDYFNVVCIMKRYGNISKELFDKPIGGTCWILNNLLEPSVVRGSQSDRVYDFFQAYLLSMDGKSVSDIMEERTGQDELMFTSIHKFITSLPYSPSGSTEIRVDFTEGKFARTSTCTNTIYLPLAHENQEDFGTYMNLSVLGSGKLIEH